MIKVDVREKELTVIPANNGWIALLGYRAHQEAKRDEYVFTTPEALAAFVEAYANGTILTEEAYA